MPRIRTMKPEFWSDEKLSLLDPLTRLVFLGLISMADDHGRLVDNIKLLDGQLFPNTDDSAREPLETLASIGRVIRYRATSGQSVVQIVNWERHQKVTHPGKEVLPPPDDAVLIQQPPEGLTKVSRDSHETLAPLPSDLVTNDLRPSDRAFEEAWEKYPPRTGSNARRDALQSWHARIREREDPAVMAAGVVRYRRFLEAQGKCGTEFVMQGKRFFGPSKHYLEPWDPPEAPLDPAAAAAIAFRDQQADDDAWLEQRIRERENGHTPTPRPEEQR